MPPTVADAIREGHRGIRQLEPDVLRDLLRAYDRSWWAVEAHIRRYERQIAEAVVAGIEPRPSWLRQQRWYTQLQVSIDAEMARFQQDAAAALARGQAQAVGVASQSAGLFAEAVGVSGAIVPQVHAGAIERWVSALRPGSPVRGVLAKYGERFEQVLLESMSEGIGSGQGASGIIRQATRALGPDASAGRIATVVRTETMRSFRGASRDQYEAMGPKVVGEWEWRAGLSARCCLACVSMHRRRFPYAQYPDRFHPACRCTVVAVPRAELVPPVGRPGETGEAWLARQPEDVQRRILGTQARYDLYRQGAPLDRFVGVRTSRTWGDSVTVLPASAVKLPAINAPRTPPVFGSLDEARAWAEPAFREWPDSLTPTERDAVETYRAVGYRDINGALRRGDTKALPDLQPEIDAIDRALTKGTVDRDVTVYRGIKTTRLGNVHDLEGTVIQDNGFVSTAIDDTAARKFVNYAIDDEEPAALMQIFVPKGTNGAYLDSLSPDSTWREDELLLPRGRSFRVVRVVTGSDNVPVIHMELLP